MKQLSDEWFLAHVGRLTGSKMDTVINGGAKAWITMLNKMKAEMENPELILEKGYQSKGMERGIILEEEAVDHYELINNVDVERPAFVVSPKLDYVACSPDFHRPDVYVVGEVKCPENPNIHMMTVVHGTGAETYKPQIQTEIHCTSSDYCHFVSYDPRVKDPAKQIHTTVIEKHDAYISRMLERCEEFYAYLTTDTRPAGRFADDSIPSIF